MSLGSDFSDDEELVAYFMEYLETAHSEMKTFIDVLPSAESPEQILASLYSHAHNLKGMAFSFGYHLLTNVTSSLCHYLKHRGTTLNTEIVISHVEAIDAIATHKINGDGGEKGDALLAQLRGGVQNALPATKTG